ncbi:MAG TPA: hypothetical protein VHX38_18970 [Pseudonocardiaceae bacterium]|jgi:hypothetical protein|nr:hypothetical protein [Pseudonocardiaceae bacterium]
MPTTGNLAGSSGIAGTKTLLQLATPTNRQLTVISWGYSIQTLPTTVGGGIIDLVSQNVADTVTAHIASGLQPLDPNLPASLLQLGTALSGYNASAQGAVTTSRAHDSNFVNSVAGTDELTYEYQFMPDERPIVAISSFLKIRATVMAGSSIICWVVWDE